MTTTKNRQVNQPDQYMPVMDDADSNYLTVHKGFFGAGVVPIGGMVVVMPNIDVVKAWQPPATGVIKDGFMRADGVTISASHIALGCKLTVGTVLPNMIAKYPRGNTTSSTTGGANGIYLSTSQVPQMSVAISGTSGGGSPHGHGISDPGHTHVVRHAQGQALGDGQQGGGPYPGVVNDGSYDNIFSASGSGTNISIVNESGHTHGVGSYSGLVGQVSPAIIANEPAYVEVVWVIRVK